MPPAFSPFIMKGYYTYTICKARRYLYAHVFEGRSSRNPGSVCQHFGLDAKRTKNRLLPSKTAMRREVFSRAHRQVLEASRAKSQRTIPEREEVRAWLHQPCSHALLFLTVKTRQNLTSNSHLKTAKKRFNLKSHLCILWP